MKSFVCCLALLCLTMTAFGQTKPNKHYIFALHGIGGGYSVSDRFMREAFLGNISPSQLSKEQYVFEYFEYDTHSEVKGVEDFTARFTQYLENYFKISATLNAGDKVSFVTGSQGALVCSRWVLQAMESDKYTAKTILNSLDSLIFVAPPFWGSHWANVGSFLKNKFGINMLVKMFGKKQMVDMSYNSDKMYEFLEMIHAPIHQKNLIELSKRIRFKTVFGNIHPDRYGLSRIWPHVLESDFTVAVASANLNHIYYSDVDGEARKFITAEDFTETNFNVTTEVVEGFHLSSPEFLLGNWAKKYHNIYPSILQTPSSCSSKPLDQCGSPVTEAIVNHFNKIPESPMPPLKDFHIDVVAVVRENLIGSSLNAKDIEIQIVPEDIEELNAMTKLDVERKTAEKRFTFGGSMDQRKSIVKMVVTKRGYSARFLEVPVEQSKTTFVRINLEPL